MTLLQVTHDRSADEATRLKRKKALLIIGEVRNIEIKRMSKYENSGFEDKEDNSFDIDPMKPDCLMSCTILHPPHPPLHI